MWEKPLVNIKRGNMPFGRTGEMWVTKRPNSPYAECHVKRADGCYGQISFEFIRTRTEGIVCKKIVILRSFRVLAGRKQISRFPKYLIDAARYFAITAYARLNE